MGNIHLRDAIMFGGLKSFIAQRIEKPILQQKDGSLIYAYRRYQIHYESNICRGYLC